MVNSFNIDHRTLKAGVYEREHKFLTKTWDVRFVAPSEHQYMTPGAMHVLEHFFAFNLRRDRIVGEKIVAVCPMGCLTGMYIITSESATMYEIVEALKSVLRRFPILYLDDVPGMNVMQCGNPQLNDIKNANLFARRFYEVLTNVKKAGQVEQKNQRGCKQANQSTSQPIFDAKLDYKEIYNGAEKPRQN